jgi:hypothetical protein
MNVLIELAVPNGTRNKDATKFLIDLREGIEQPFTNSPINKVEVRLDDDDAKDIKQFESAGNEYELVSALLNLVERLYHGDSLDESSKRLFRIAAIAAPLTRRSRVEAGIDQE